MKPSLKAPRQKATTERTIHQWTEGRLTAAKDTLAIEEPLEIRVRVAGKEREEPLSVTMRTPGNDDELALGFLYAEGVVGSARDVARIDHEPPPGEAQEFNSVLVTLAAGVTPDLVHARRPFVVTSACGVCGRSSLEHLRDQRPPRLIPDRPQVSAATLRQLPGVLRSAQTVFEATGGLHAAALFDAAGKLQAIREDVGRHNALDKLVGDALQGGRVPLTSSVLLVSGRASFEILQKSVRAGIPFVAAVGAPSSLAVDVAQEFGVTLVGFLRADRFNVYAGQQRVAVSPSPPRRA